MPPSTDPQQPTQPTPTPPVEPTPAPTVPVTQPAPMPAPVTPVPGAAPMPMKSAKGKKGMKLVVIVIVLLALIGGAVAAWFFVLPNFLGIKLTEQTFDGVGVTMSYPEGWETKNTDGTSVSTVKITEPKEDVADGEVDYQSNISVVHLDLSSVGSSVEQQKFFDTVKESISGTETGPKDGYPNNEYIISVSDGTDTTIGGHPALAFDAEVGNVGDNNGLNGTSKIVYVWVDGENAYYFFIEADSSDAKYIDAWDKIINSIVIN